MKICGAILIVIIVLGIAGFWKRKIFLILASGAAVCFASAAADEYLHTSKTVESIEKNDVGEGGYQKELLAKTEDGREIEVIIDVPEKSYTKSKANEILENEKRNLDGVILGENESFENVNRNLMLPETGQNHSVSVVWYSSDPEVINSKGEIQDGVKTEGQEVILNAVLTLQDVEADYIKKIRVYPKKELENIETDIQNEIKLKNSENAGGEYILPESVGNVDLVWYERPENSYTVIAFLIFIFGVLMNINKRQKEDEKAKKRNEILKKEYPEFISRLLLMLYSGTGVRTAFFKMAAMYDGSKKESNTRSEVFEEVMAVCREMENGSDEDEAYEKLAERCPPPCYRRLSVLLIQNRRRGGKGFINELEQEVMISFGEKRRQAEAAGNAASLKLLIPLGMMLIIVLALMMIPAFMYM